jgi:hypothetical protein
MIDNFRHCMIDIETLSTQQNAAIIQIAAVVFNPLNGQTDKYFVRNIGSIDIAGLDVALETIEWHQKTRYRVLYGADSNDRVSLMKALFELDDFLCAVGPSYIWANSPAFDINILLNAYKQMDHLDVYLGKARYKTFMDVRTLKLVTKALFPDYDIKRETPDIHKHDALNDCYAQIKEVFNIYRTLVGTVNGLSPIMKPFILKDLPGYEPDNSSED